MQKLTKEESIKYIGGDSVSAAMISAITSLVNTIYKIGQHIGATIKRRTQGISC